MSGAVFLCFSGNDRKIPRQVTQNQEAEGTRIWWDKQGIGWGENWIKNPQEELSGYSVYLISYRA